jgi:hypothetical protein
MASLISRSRGMAGEEWKWPLTRWDRFVRRVVLRLPRWAARLLFPRVLSRLHIERLAACMEVTEEMFDDYPVIRG